jgi:rod shape determining protein RodA
VTAVAERSPTAVRRLDWSLLVAVVALLALGCLLVWSATAHRTALTGGDPQAYLVKQILNILVGVAIAVPVAMVDHRRLRFFAPAAYLVVVAGLVLVLVVGATVNGSQSWIRLPGGFSLQPGEFAKVAVVVGMALVFAERRENAGRSARPARADLVWALAVAAVPIGLVGIQPDLGTVFVLLVTGFGLLTLAGTPLRWLFGLLLVAATAAYGAFRAGLLEGYQLARLTAFVHPELDPEGIGYNAEQARLAIGSGGLFGAGLFNGSRTSGAYVPEQHTDFVFTVAGEELGFVGSSALLLLLAFVLWRGVRIARAAPDLFGRLLAGGVVCWFGAQVFENVGMTLGLMPITGLPLPFVSYGGSSMVACLVAVALLENVHLRGQDVAPV